MRHHKSGRKLSRTSSHREAMFKNMAVSLFRYEQITTTLAKAKELRRVAEPLITLGKAPSVANRRLAFARLRDREAVAKLFDELGTRYKDRPGGYLRILKFGFRNGDSAPLALVQLLDRPEPNAAGQPAAVEEPAKQKKPKVEKVQAEKKQAKAKKEAPEKAEKEKKTRSAKKAEGDPPAATKTAGKAATSSKSSKKSSKKKED